ncbi:MAG: alanine--tRNA ligase [Candidatus Omnitrophica bacterium]|nr:alanine--tRNA ligase [Candidatus Omnitrophota bacterium]
MKTSEIRKKYLDFFRSKRHEIVPSDSLVPRGDPTLLFTSAGMNQFKEQFMARGITYRRAASCQKCLRTGDLERVGKTSCHHTFFEMLGNFSFGDYFKKEAILWGWEFMTKELGIKKEKLWVSVYKDDKESYNIWKDVIKLPEKRILKLGPEENFWPANAPKDGPNGPCGPCTEIFYDLGANGKDLVEVWNLVFTQFNRKSDGSLEPLPSKNIDTGMGLERIAAVMQGVKTNFEIDIFTPIIEELKAYSLKLKAEDINAIADHIRAVTFAIADDVPPSNEEKGYVIRKLIRRAYMRAKADEPFLYKLVHVVVEAMKDAYPELQDRREGISLIVKEEEERFKHTLSLAMPILHDELKAVKKGVLKGEVIFKLVDTYGLPLEVIEQEAGKKKIKTEQKTFLKLMNGRRELSKKKSKIEEDIFAGNAFRDAPIPECSRNMPLKAKIAFMAKGKGIIKKAKKDDTVQILTNPQSSLFYTEAGGQIGDKGIIRVYKGKEGTIRSGKQGVAEILNTVKIGERTVHFAQVTEGTISTGDMAEVIIDSERKKLIARNHTATHLLHSALRKVLGAHVHQAGSLVNADRFRFDFAHGKKLTDREIERIEELVSVEIKKAVPVKKEEMSLDKAKEEGAVALFGEKYEKTVKVITCGDFSKEVCGGTHIDNTKDIELFKITRESSIASGVRRIEAVTSSRAKDWLEDRKKQKAKIEQLDKQKEKEKKEEKELLEKAKENVDEIIKKAKDIGGVKVIAEEIKNSNMGILRKLAGAIKSKEENLFLALAASEGGKVSIVLSVTKGVASKGIDASAIIKDIAKIVEGSGGGRADFAQAGGNNPGRIKEALECAVELAEERIRGNKGR